MARIFLVEDSEGLREATAEYLRNDGHDVRVFETGHDVAEAVRAARPDLCILDIMLPGRSGLFIGREIRRFSDTPFIFMTARDDERSRVAGFEAGGDDYVVKPFSPRELVMRVRAILRRASPESSVGPAQRPVAVYRIGSNRLVVDLDSRTATVNGVATSFTRTEWDILTMLTQEPGTVIEREMLLDTVFAYGAGTESRTLDTHLKNLRAKLGAGEWIQTMRGVGYRFMGDAIE
ncbi:MAG: response regulator transcription factor [Spirochaetales bacterium]|nr:response regulator transcription factor [Spirochaetales bacterium]